MSEPNDRAASGQPVGGPRWASIEDLRVVIGNLSTSTGSKGDSTPDSEDGDGASSTKGAVQPPTERLVVTPRPVEAESADDDTDDVVAADSPDREGPDPKDPDPEDVAGQDADNVGADVVDAEVAAGGGDDSAGDDSESDDSAGEDSAGEDFQEEDSAGDDSDDGDEPADEEARAQGTEAGESTPPNVDRTAKPAAEPDETERADDLRTPRERIDAALKSRTTDELPITGAVFAEARSKRPNPLPHVDPDSATVVGAPATGAPDQNGSAPPQPGWHLVQPGAPTAANAGSAPNDSVGQGLYAPSPPRRSRVPLVVGGVLGVGLLAVLGAMFATKDVVPRGTTIGGVDVGQMSRSAAISALEQRAPTAQAPLPVIVGGESATVDPGVAGLSLDADASVQHVLGGTFNPTRLWHYIVGGQAAEAAPEPDRAKLTAAMRSLADDTKREPVNGSVTFAGSGPQAVDAVVGVELQESAAADVLAEQWLARDGAVDLPVAEKQPQITQAEVDRAMTEVAENAADGGLTLVIGDKTVSVPQAAVLPTLSMQPSAEDPTKLTLVVDGEALRTAVLAGQAGLEAEAKDAKIVLQDGLPTVIPSKDGIKLDPKQLAAEATKALQTPQRSITLTAAVVKPSFTTEQAKALGVKEKVSTFSTKLTDNPGRTENLRIAARTVNGTLVKPGETFSLNGVLGRRTTAKGYNEAPAIQNGRLQQDVGGGVSQMATTIFNNVFFAGLEDVTHKPHSFYISRYPEGREATVNYPTVDLKWKNDTKYGVLIEASAVSQVTVSFWSTKIYDKVDAYKSPRRNIRAPQQIYDPSSGCVPQAPSEGFDVTVSRKVYQDGKVFKTNSWTTHYIAEDHVICGPKPAAKPTVKPVVKPSVSPSN